MTTTAFTDEEKTLVDFNVSLVPGIPNLDPVSNEMRQLLQVIIYLFMCGTMSLFGIGTNTLNIVVFVKHGFKDSINISLLGLAVADLSIVVTMFVISMGFNPLVDYTELSVNLLDVMYLAVGWPHVYFNRVSSFITAFISLERCLCVTLPLNVRTIFTPRRTTVTVLLIFCVIWILLSPFYFVNKLDWCYNQMLNRTIFSLKFTKNRVEIETATFPIHSVAMPTISLLSVIICTTILVVQLNRKSKWRQSSVTQNSSSKPGTVFVKEKKLVKMVIFLSTIFIFCYLPSTLSFLMMIYEPEFSITGRYVNLYLLIWSLIVFVETVNSSVNFLVYLRMSTKYRQTVEAMFSVNSKIR